MNQQTVMTFQWSTALPREDGHVLLEKKATGFANLNDAEMWGHGQAVVISMEWTVRFYLSRVSDVEGQNFVCCPGPLYYEEDVVVDAASTREFHAK